MGITFLLDQIRDEEPLEGSSVLRPNHRKSLIRTASPVRWRSYVYLWTVLAAVKLLGMFVTLVFYTPREMDWNNFFAVVPVEAQAILQEKNK